MAFEGLYHSIRFFLSVWIANFALLQLQSKALLAIFIILGNRLNPLLYLLETNIFVFLTTALSYSNYLYNSSIFFSKRIRFFISFINFTGFGFVDWRGMSGLGVETRGLVSTPHQFFWALSPPNTSQFSQFRFLLGP